MNFWETIFLFFAFQAFLFAIFLFLKRKGDTIANRILGAFLIIFSLNLVYNVLYWSNLIYQGNNVHVYGALVLLWLSYPPLIYLYSKRVIGEKLLNYKDTVHLIPIFAALILYFPFYRLSASEKLEALQTWSLTNYIPLVSYVAWGVLLSMISYTLYTYLKFRNFPIDNNKRRWFHWMLGSFACYVLAMFSYFVLSRLGLIDTRHDYFIMFNIILFISAITYFGIMQPEIFEGRSMDSILPFRKYQKTGLSENHSLEMKQQLEEYFQQKKPYLKSDLRLSDLAEELNLSRHHTSQIINEHFDVSFFDFVNGYRIEEAKKLLLEDNNLNITDVIYSCGFNNRVSFYRIFKKHTSITPSEFKKQAVVH